MVRLVYKSLFAIWVFCCAWPGVAAEVTLPAGRDLQADGRQALERGLPILLEFSAVNCAYCRQLEREFLIPMLISGEYGDKVIIRRLLLDTGAHVTDFDGDYRAATAIAGRYKAWVTPTMVFIDGNGNELAERITGINTPELFGGYLDACIDTALLRIREPDSTVIFAGCSPVIQP